MGVQLPGLGRSPGRGNGNPLQHSCLENPIDRGAWWATVHGVTKSRTRLKRQHVMGARQWDPHLRYRLWILLGDRWNTLSTMVPLPLLEGTHSLPYWELDPQLTVATDRHPALSCSA